MIKAVIELSRYFFVIHLFIYTMISYVVLKTDDEQRKSFPFFVQYACIFLNHMIASFVLLSTNQNITYFFFPIIQIIVLFCFMILMRAIYPYANRLLSSHVVLLLSIGLLMLTRLSLTKSMKQFAIIAGSLVVVLMIPKLMQHIEVLYRFKWIFCILGITILTLVLLTGNVVNGSKLSFSIKGIRFQPSEFVKIFFVIFVAAFLSQAKNFFHIFVTSILAAIHVLLLVFSKDLGSALLFFTTYIFMLYVSTAKKRYLFLGAIFSICASVVSYYLFSHVRVRVSAWLNPWDDITKKGYQVAQSLFAIGTGKWFGMGLSQGVPATIPYVEQDFIFSAICEEYGVLFGILLIAVCVNLFLEILHVAKDCEEHFLQMLAYGLGMLYVSQIFLTIGGNTKFIPLTGVTLPFISYGGSSVLTSLMMIGIVQGLFLNYNAAFTQEIPVIRKRQINFSAFVFSALFSMIVCYMFVFVKLESPKIVNNAYNGKRQDIIASNTIRGSILAADGSILATTSTIDGHENRVYPFGNVFSHAIGYDTNGKMGLEKTMNMELVSSNISLGDKLENDISDQKHIGNTIVTTFDTTLQKAAYDALGVYDGAVVITEPSTGAILAMVSKPDFNPMEVEKNWDVLIQDDSSSVLVNRATQGLYPPGSTFKIFTALEYMRENPETFKNYCYQCKGVYVDGEDRIQCYHRAVHGNLDFLMSFAKSCNSSFANIGMSLDREDFSDTLDTCFFNRKWPTLFETKQSHVALSANSKKSDVMQTCIGQGETQVTPLHIAAITGAIANEGKMMMPYMVSCVKNANNEVIKQYESAKLCDVMSKEEADNLKQMMIAVVEKGTATRLESTSYKAAGKTGSAEFNSKGDSHAWFTGFTYDTQKPLQITVIMEDAGSGGEFAVPVAKRILETYYK